MKLRPVVLLACFGCTVLPIEARAQDATPVAESLWSFPAANPSSIYWVRGEYLAWWLKDQAVPPLVTTSTTQASVGRIGFPDTTILYGGDVDGKVRQGFRVTAGAAPYWVLDDSAQLGVEGSFFMLAPHNNSFAASSAGDPVLARPFVDALNGQSRVEQVANLLLTGNAGNLLARAVAGTVTVSNPSSLLGSELNGALIIGDGEMFKVDLLAGARYLYFQESLNIGENLLQESNAAFGIPQTNFVVQDRFHTQNEFFGGQVGVRTLFQLDGFCVELLGKVALGSTHQMVAIDGATTATVAGAAPITGVGGLLALPTNIGSYSRDHITVVPEINLNVGYQFTPWLRAFVGYDFFYWSSVVRAGQQLDLTVNPNYIPPPITPTTGPARPAFLGAASDLWVQGVTIGVQLSY